MPFLVILKRFEVWLLLAVVAALLVVALRDEAGPVPPGGEGRAGGPTLSAPPAPGPDAAGPEPAPEGEAPTAPIALRGVRVLESSGGLVVETTLQGRSPSGEDLVLDESNASATTAEGEPAPRFFEPFRETASLAGTEDSLATLRWWLVRPTRSLSLDVEGVPVHVELP